MIISGISFYQPLDYVLPLTELKMSGLKMGFSAHLKEQNMLWLLSW